MRETPHKPNTHVVPEFSAPANTDSLEAVLKEAAALLEQGSWQSSDKTGTDKVGVAPILPSRRTQVWACPWEPQEHSAPSHTAFQSKVTE